MPVVPPPSAHESGDDDAQDNADPKAHGDSVSQDGSIRQGLTVEFGKNGLWRHSIGRRKGSDINHMGRFRERVGTGRRDASNVGRVRKRVS